MNLLRNVFIVGIAVTFYLMILEWQKDYHSPASKEKAEAVTIDDSVINDSANAVEQFVTNDFQSDRGEGLASGDLPAVPVQPEANKQIDDSPSTIEEKNRFVLVETDNYVIKIDLYGGDIVETFLKNYPVDIESPNMPFHILDDENGKRYIAQSGIIGKSGKDLNAQDGRPFYRTDHSEYKMNGETLEVVLEYVESSGLKVSKQFSFKKGDYLIDLSYEFNNTGANQFVGTPFSQLKREGFPDPSTGGFASSTTFLGAAYWLPDERFNKLDFDDIKESVENREKPLDEKVRGGWVSIVQHYFLAAWIPPVGQLNHYYAKYLESKDEYIIGSTSESFSVKPGEIKKLDSLQLYVGPKLQDRLETISDGLELSVDYGILFFISSALFTTLKFIYSYTQNWGWAIILLTVLIKALFYVPSAMSYRSMANIRRVQPELLRLREQYGEDKQKLSQEMMKLYQKEKINPLGGCLPILLQMPVFIALYWALLESVELRHAEWIFWIKDLSSMDQYFVLPLLMGVSMFIQTSLNPAPPDPMQAKIMKFMPIIFTIFFLFFPSGLVLYWLTNNILSIAQQWWITKGIERGNGKTK